MFQVGNAVRLRGRVTAIRKVGKTQFLKLNINGGSSIQVVAQQKLDFTKDSIVTVEGRIASAVKPVESCAFKNVEVIMNDYEVDSLSERSPYEADANLDTLLNHRTVSLRSGANQAIFRMQHEVTKEFRRFLDDRDFVEIQTPKIVSGASEGGANVFKVNYFDRPAFLAQSPQLYKQMAIGADFDKVYTVGPVFRAENSNTHRHLTEFVGLDVEMAVEHEYSEVTDLFGQLMQSIFKKLKSKSQLLDQVRKEFHCQEFTFLDKTLVLQHKEAVDLLRGSGLSIGQYDDFDTSQERKLGQIVKQKYGTDFFIVDQFPLRIRPFYTMPDPNDAVYSNSYDVYMRGEEIMSGSQRIHDYGLLTERVKQCGFDINSIQPYLEAFKYGMPPHAGGGIGLERVVMLFLDLKNIRRASMFPRDPKRLEP